MVPSAFAVDVDTYLKLKCWVLRQLSALALLRQLAVHFYFFLLFVKKIVNTNSLSI